MKFNKSLLSAALLLGLGVMANANAALPHGTVTIKGKIVPDTCEVNSPVVTLPTLTDLQANALPQNGPSPVGQQTNFSIDYTHCTLIDGGYTIQPDFSALTNFNSTTKTLANTGSAQHIALGIVNPSAPNVLLDLKSNVIAAQTATTGTISFPLAATYVAQGTVTPGTVAAVAAFSTIYN